MDLFFRIQGNSVFKPQAPAKIAIEASEAASSSKILKGVYNVRDIEAIPRLAKGVYNASELEAAATSTMHENAKFIKGIFNVADIEAAIKTDSNITEGFGTDVNQCKVESFGSFGSNNSVFYQGLFNFNFKVETISKEGNSTIFKNVKLNVNSMCHTHWTFVDVAFCESNEKVEEEIF